MLAELTQLGARVAGVSTDTWFENRRFGIAEGIAFPLLSDWPDSAAVRAFGVAGPSGRARRVTVIADDAGVVRAVIDGERSPEAHAAAALAAVQALGGRSRGDDSDRPSASD